MEKEPSYVYLSEQSTGPEHYLPVQSYTMYCARKME